MTIYKHELDLLSKESFEKARIKLIKSIKKNGLPFPEAIEKIIDHFIGKQKFDDASQILKIALKKMPKHARYLAQSSYCHAQAGSLTTAINLASQSLAINQNQPTVALNKACWLARTSGDPIEVKKYFEDWSSKYLDKLAEKSDPIDLLNYEKNKKIRIGYVSGDLKNHSVRYFIEPFLKLFDRERFDVHAFMTMPEDEISQILKPLVSKWHNVSDLKDRELFKLIREERINILVDLSGHTKGSRIEVFAMRAAPVQVTWFGFMQTLGVSAIDYRLTDSSISPPGTDEHYTEKPYRLDCMVAYSPPVNAEQLHSLPSKEKGTVTMVSLNDPRKITDEMLASWRNIMSANLNCGLIVISTEKERNAAERQLKQRFESLKFDMERVLIHQRLTMLEFLNISSVADFALDTYPLSGGTIVLHALWIGLPIVSLDGHGQTGMSSAASSTLRGVGLDEFVANSLQDYENHANRLISDPSYLQNARDRCRPALQSSPLMDHQKRVRDVEAAYLHMWRNKLSNLA